MDWISAHIQRAITRIVLLLFHKHYVSMSKINEGILQVLKADFIPTVASGKLGGLLNELSGFHLNKGLQNDSCFLIEVGDAHFFGNLVDKALVGEERHVMVSD